jgi:hypothetical protein
VQRMKQVQFLFAKRSSLCIKKYPTPASERGVQKGKTLEEIQFKIRLHHIRGLCRWAFLGQVGMVMIERVLLLQRVKFTPDIDPDYLITSQLSNYFYDEWKVQSDLMPRALTTGANKAVSA